MDLQTARTELKTFMEREKTGFLDKPGFGPLEETICHKVDEIVVQVWARTGKLEAKGFALLAIGGYGRRTLHPESDLDLLLFFKDKVDESVVKAVLDPLWDLPFRVGHQIRLASDFKVLCRISRQSLSRGQRSHLCRIPKGSPSRVSTAAS